MLVSKNVPFEKLSCVASDVAASMIGSTNGMSAHLRRLFARKYGQQHCKMESLWCFAHRLNLVIRDFQHVDYINSVIRFCDLFTTKRRAICYKNGWKRSQTTNSEKYQNHQRQDGRFIETFSMYWCLKLIKLKSSSRRTEIWYLSWPRLGNESSPFQMTVHLFSFTIILSSHTSASHFLFSTGFVPQTHNFKRSTSSYLKHGFQ